jgi:glycosyltransferase involved in cell wall biosynthesis
MRIAVDARMGHTRVGMGVYVSGLISHLGEIDRENEYFITVHKRKNADFVPVQENFAVWETSISYENHLTRDAWEQAYLPLKLHKAKIDVYHGPNYVLPIFAKNGMVLTIYDMTLFATQDWYNPISRFRTQRLLKISAGKAQKIIAGSENSKRDIIKILGVPEEKVRVIYIGIDGMYKPINDQHQLDSVKIRSGITNRFILHVGSLNPRKNIPRLIEAYNRLPPDIRQEYQLVIAGKSGWKADEVFAEVKQIGLEDKVVFTGFMGDNDLPVLMNGADLLAFPSLYEGFGIPPLEAMACGTPVIASNTSSIPEVVGDAALLFDPYNVEEMANAIYRALTDERLRNELRQKGFEHVKQFSWERAARETLAVYEEVYNLTGKAK